jgi:hypothetical protein
MQDTAAYRTNLAVEEVRGVNGPTAQELMSDPTVVSALASAWHDSLPHDSYKRHEEGGWIYCHASSGVISVKRALHGSRSYVDLSSPPHVEGHVVVATFHTHPNPTSEGWYPGPSNDDSRSAWYLGVPCIIQADDGVYTTGPSSRRGGLSGSPAFPFNAEEAPAEE